MGGTAIRHSTRCAGQRGRATAGTTRAVPDGSTTHSSADRIVVNSYNHTSWVHHHKHLVGMPPQPAQTLRQAARTVGMPLQSHTHGGYATTTTQTRWVYIIGIDHDTVCAGVVGTAIRNSTSCAGRRAAACGRAGRHNECCSGLQYQPRQHRPYKWSI